MAAARVKPTENKKTKDLASVTWDADDATRPSMTTNHGTAVLNTDTWLVLYLI